MPLRRRNPQGALILRAISALLVVNDAINIASSSRLDLARKINARGLLYFHHGLLANPFLPGTPARANPEVPGSPSEHPKTP
jgi:hypothetical protein